MKKRLTALLLSLCLVMAWLPITAAAEETAQSAAMTYPVHVLQKTGSDKNNLVILIFGEGFTQNQQTQFLEAARLRFQGMLQMEPYSRFARHINAYAIPMVSNEAGVSDKYGDKVDTYFGLMADGKTLKFQDQRYIDRVTAIRSWMEEQYLEDGADVNTMHFLLNTTASIGSSSGVMYSFSALDSGSESGSVMAHEIAHSLGKLGDEYGYDTNAPNVSDTADPNQIKWKELLGFRSIRIIPGNAEGRWIPTNQQCNMYTLGEPFCEVCRLQYIRRLSDRVTDGPDLYVAQPEVTTEHSNTADSANYRVTQENLLRSAKDATLELRTVVQNLTDAPRTIRLHLAITAADGTVKEEKQEDFALAALKSSYNMEEACIYPSVKVEIWSEMTEGDSLTGEVLEVLADGSTRLLDTYEGQAYETYTVQYQTEDGQTIPNSFAARIPLAKGTDPRALAPQTLAGRPLIKTEVSGQTLTLTYGAQAAERDKCGDNAAWRYNPSDGTLTISGSGRMYDYPNARPWESVSAQIQHVVIENGITYVGSHAFANMGSLHDIQIPPSVTEIGEGACRAGGLYGVVIPATVTAIGKEAFHSLGNGSVIYVENSAFASQEKLGDADNSAICILNGGKMAAVLEPNRFAVPTRQDYVFQGWYETADGQTAETKADTPAAGKTYIAKWSISDINETVQGYSGQYDGKAHHITVSYPAEAGITGVQYSKDGGRNYAEENPVFKDVTNGKQTVWYRLLFGSEMAAYGSATVEITPCDNPVTLTASPASLQNGGTVTLTAVVRPDADDGSIRLGAVQCDQSDIQVQESGTRTFTVNIPAFPSKAYTFMLAAEGDWIRNSKNPAVQAVVTNAYHAPSQGGGGGGGGGSSSPSQGGAGTNTPSQAGGTASTSTEKTDTGKTKEGKAGETKPNGKSVIKMQVGSRTVTVDEKTISANVAPVIRNSRTLVPIRMITETLGGRVSWNAKTKEVVLTIDGKEIKMTIGKTLAAYGTAPVVINDRTFVPVRFVADELGAEVKWDNTTKTVTILADRKSVDGKALE